jgi:glycolate dehydrogenase FAD-binding subunit
MAVEATRRESPADREAALGLLREASELGKAVRFSGGGTKLGWGASGAEPELELSTGGLDTILEHNEGDLTAVLEAGVPLAAAQERFASAGQMLALDPPDPGGATIGGVVAAGDSGPLRHRYNAARDLVVGVTVALPDGSLAHAGGKVIKNVAGYDLGKLMAGSFGTLGLIVELALRLHPSPERTVTAAGGTLDAGQLAGAAAKLSHAPIEALSLDVRWGGGDGALLARFGGASALEQAEQAAERMKQAGLDGSVVEDDSGIWDRQREAQRSETGTVIRISGLQTQLRAACEASGRLGGRLVGRAAAGIYWISFEGAESAAIEELRRELSPSPCVLLDAPPAVREAVDPWGPQDPGALELMRRVKERFDPAGVCNPGVFAGGI